VIAVAVLRSCVVRDQDLVLDAIEDAQRISAEHIEPGSHRTAETTINMLLFLLDRREKWWPLSDGSAMDMGCAS
jgi:hypothetical protein